MFNFRFKTLYPALTLYYWIIFAVVGYGSTCGPPTPPRGATIIHPLNQEKYEKGSVVLFGCKQGFYLVGKPIIKCLGSTWTQRQFRCAGFCPDLRQISNGQVIETRPNIGRAAVEFRCIGKFRLVGRSRLECIDGRWNGKLPFCEKLKSCPRLRAPRNVTLHGSDTTHGAKASFACLTGFDLFGSPTVICNDGVWSANVPTCKAYCMKIRDPPNGRKLGTGFSHGRVVSFECKLGFELVGDRALRCIHGRWNSSVPVCKATLCSKPTIPSNSYIIYPQTNQVNYTHRTHVFLACRDGYYLKGSPIMVCNQTVWFKREFSCIASCPVVDSIKNGIITHATLKEGGEVEIACHTNFTLVGSSKLTCIKGKWSDSLPSCKEPCSDPGLPHQGNRIGGDFRHGKPVTFTCPRDYVMKGVRTIKCSDGRWSYEKPSCKAPCKEIAPPAHGRRMGEDFRHGFSARFICSYGYERIGASTIRCNDGNWSNPTPACKGICPPLRTPYRGRLHGNKSPFLDGDEVTFSCDKKYDLFGKARVRCVGKKWDSSAPECKASCDPLTALSDGKVQSNNLKHGALASFSCNKGFQLKGPNQITCINGKWNESYPVCKVVQCGDPGKPANGEQLVNKGFVYGGSVEFKCNKDYTLRGTFTIYCQENKEWTASVPRCLAPCPDPGLPYQGNRIGGDFRHGKTVVFTCPKDYIMEGVRTIKCSEGRWSFRKPSCKAPCSELAPPAHGWRSGEDFRHGRSVKFYCSYGHTNVGASSLTCNDSNWNNLAPACKGICPQPRTPFKGRLHGIKKRFIDGDEVTFSCDSSYDVFGKERLRCVGKNWDSSVPVCKARCSFSRRAEGGLYVEGKSKKNDMIKHGETITYSCLPAYKMVGSKTQECDNGRWTSDAPVCKAPCPSLGGVAHGRKIRTGYRHGEDVWYRCDAEYTLNGSNRLTCSDGRWNHDPPECKAPCDNPGTPLYGNMQGDNFRHDSWVKFSCNRNYQLDGDKNIRCNDGSWSGSVPNCVAVCPDPGEPSNGKRLNDNFQEGETVTFECNKDHDLVGNDTIRCGAGAWSGGLPECKRPTLGP